MKALILGLAGIFALPPLYAQAATPPNANNTIANKINLSSLNNQPDYQNFIVHFAADSPQRRDVAQLLAELDVVAADVGVGIQLQRQLGVAGAFVIHSDQALAKADAEKLMRAFARRPTVSYIEPDVLLTANFTPKDALYGYQWHYFEPTGGLNLPGAWDVSTGSNTVIAVLDTGYTDHPDLLGNIVSGYDFISDTFIANDGNGRDSDARDPGDWTAKNECASGSSATSSSWHGTHVAGTIAAVANTTGVVGVAFGAKVLPLRVLGKCGGYLSDISDAIVWAAGGTVPGVPANTYPARVINMSLGGSGQCGATFQNAINGANQRGATVVAAAGNSNADAVNHTPSNCNGVIAVAATDKNGAKASFSNYGNVVDVAAPGVSIVSTRNDGTTTPTTHGYYYMSGTSMATPHIAGLAGLMLSQDPTLTPAAVEAGIKANARPFPSTCTLCGSGIADAEATLLSLAQPVTEIAPLAPSNLTGTAQSSSQIKLDWQDNSDNESQFAIERSPDANVWQPLAVVTANTTTHLDGNLTPGSTYFYRVKAVNNSGDSEFSNAIEAGTLEQLAIPTTPVGLTATDLQNSQAQLNWSAADNATQYQIQRESFNSKRNAWSSLNLVYAGSGTSYTDNSGTGTFRYQIRASNDAGNSTWSAWQEVTVTSSASTCKGKKC